MDPLVSADYRNDVPPGMPEWAATVAGGHALRWEQGQIDHWVGDVFGYHAVQLGMPDLQALRCNRMPHRWLVRQQMPEAGVTGAPAPDSSVGRLFAEPDALPFGANSLDLVVMPHTLENCADPHQALREVERVLRPEGRLLITGFNPASLWGITRRGRRLAPWAVSERHAVWDRGDWVGYWRLRDWLRLLSFEVEGGRFGCYLPAVGSAAWLERLRWMDSVGDRWWPVLGSVYAVMAVKRVRGMRLVGLARKSSPVASAAPAVVAQRHRRAMPPDSQGRP